MSLIKQYQPKNPYSYKIIYAFSIDDERHKGLIKVGQTTLSTSEHLHINDLSQNSGPLVNAAKTRIKNYTQTAGIEPELLHTELAVLPIATENGHLSFKPFSDKDVHRVLEISDFERVKLAGSQEWFRADLPSVIAAIQAVKNNQRAVAPHEDAKEPIIFRKEQKEAIDKAKKVFRKSNRMLWNAKMRFGKTLAALQLIKDMGAKKTIILTHRPVVNHGWHQDFKKIFDSTSKYNYGSKDKHYSLSELLKKGDPFVYFASIQDLRGSDFIGGKYEKNSLVFELNWDLVIVDEAHEGTTTLLGETVIQALLKNSNESHTKVLELSGTPFNIAHKYSEDTTYTWDYIMEQKAREEWELYHPEEPNPYSNLPKMNILTYDLGLVKFTTNYKDILDKEFNFREFFLTSNGSFVHEQDVISFLNVITQTNEGSNFPYANEKFRSLCRHSLWMLPGVREAKALSHLMKQHPVFGCGSFNIINVAGEGDEEDSSGDALQKVLHAINNAGDSGYTITLSCGRLTTGVTIPEWTAVFMLSGGEKTSAASYLQTIFRVQSPHTNHLGQMKQECYVFEFAPDRVLKTVTESATLSLSQNDNSLDIEATCERARISSFLKYCPIISVQGSQMTYYNTNTLFQKVKEVYAARVVSNGFDDNKLYNHEALMRISSIDIGKFEKLREIIGASKPSNSLREIVINDQGLDQKNESTNSNKKKMLSEEEKEAKKQAKTLISILRAISIRLPLLVYGCDIEFNEEVSLIDFVNLIDDVSWEEFLPKDVSKATFIDFLKYYDYDIFVAACKKIQNHAKHADELPPLQRIQEITRLFSQFKNPDKETVLTPWRVVNLHMSECLGGYSFFDDNFDNTISEPRFVDQGEATNDTFANPKAKILEINSKSGLYPLYAAYSIFRSKCSLLGDENSLDFTIQTKLWENTIRDNIFVICRTKMAKQITRRTLLGFHPTAPANICCIEGLSEILRDSPEKFINEISLPNFWQNLETSEKLLHIQT